MTGSKKRLAALASAVLMLVSCVTVFSENEEWVTVDEADASHVRFIDCAGNVHDHALDVKDGAVSKMTDGEVQFFNGQHLYGKTGHTVSGSVYCEFTFVGTAFIYALQYRGPAEHYGTAVDVYIDGAFYTTVTGVNGNNDTSYYEALTVTGLADARHVVKLRSHDGVRVFTDLFKYLPGTGSEEGDWTRVDETDTEHVRFVSHAGAVHDHAAGDTENLKVDSIGVQYFEGGHLYGGTGHSVSGSAACEVTFIGTAFKFILQYRGPVGGYAGAADVYIDGRFYTTVADLNGNNDTSYFEALTVRGLADKKHVVKLRSHDGVRLFTDSFAYIAGTNSEADPEKGDLFADGKVNSDDAIYLLYHVFFPAEYAANQNCDFNRDGAVNADDAIYLLYHVFFSSEYPLGGIFANISGKGTSLSLVVEDDRIYITSLKAGTTEFISERSELTLPEVQLYPTEWVFESTSEKTDGGRVTRELVFADGYNGMTLTYGITANTEMTSPFEISARVENATGTDRRYKTGALFSAVADLGGATAWTFAKESGVAEGFREKSGRLINGSGIYKTALTAGASAVASCNLFQNHNSNGQIPMMYFEKDGSGAYVALEWTNGRISAVGLEDGKAGVTVDMDGVHAVGGEFVTTVAAHSVFTVPTVYLGAFEGTLDEGANVFKRWYLANKAPKNLVENENEPLTQMDMQLGYNVSQYGVQSIKWDYGWWSNDRSEVGGSTMWKTLEGSWTVRSTAYLNVLAGRTLSKFASQAADNGVRLAMYVLLHSNVDKSGDPVTTEGEFNTVAHPDWFSNRRVTGGMGFSADLGNTDCVAYLKTALTAFLKGSGITTWRSDFEPICYYSDKKNRHDANGTDVQYWATVGFSEVVEHLTENVPSFRYESCSSGGSMKDLFTATLASNINIDDSGNYTSLRMTFYDSSYCFHPVQLQQPLDLEAFCTDSPACWPKYGGEYKDELRALGLRSMMLSAVHFCCSSGPKGGALPYDLIPDVTEAMTFYNANVKPLIRNGDLYHILPRPDGTNWDGVMYVDTYGTGKAMMFVFKPSADAETTKTLKAQGLEPDALYDVTFYDNYQMNYDYRGLTGKYLMETGIPLSIYGIGSEIITITKA